MSAYKQTGYHEDSDADDEYERSVFMSPTLPPDFDGSTTTDSESPSTEHTPTTFSHSRDAASPRGLIIDWSAEQSADFISSLGLDQYADKFVDEAITGDALIALLHSDLKEMGISSIGHRITILKAVYDVKVKQGITIEPDHFIPLSADAETQESAPTQDDIARIIHIIKDRDAEVRQLREELSRISDENKKLREDVLPLIKQAKDRSQPLPSQPLPTPEDYPEQQKGSSLSRKFSTKRLFLSGSKPNNLSPTTIQEGRTLQDSSSLDPSAAAVAASSHLTASMREQPGGSPNQSQPSPTSPAYSAMNPPNSGGPPSRPFGRSPADDRSDAYSSYRDKFDPPLSGGSVTTPASASSNTVNTPQTATSSSSSLNSREHPQVEIFKSFRVSIDDPCHKVLPVALKKYNITADWRQYALYIVHGDQERCLGLNEKPLILFKQLDREGRKPMFMLRKHASPIEGSSSTIGAGGASGLSGGGGNGGGSAGLGVGTMGGSGGGGDGMGIAGGTGGRGLQLPGGVL